MNNYSVPELTKSLAKAQGQIRAAAFDKTNPHFKSRYASLASIMDACREPLSSNGLAVVQITSVEDGALMLYTTLLHESGEAVTSCYPVVSQQATPQGYGSALTYARRYSLAALIGVVADDDDDGEAATKGQNAGTTKQQPFQSTKPEPPTNGTTNGSGFQPEPGEEVWADWRNPADAKSWARTQGKFANNPHLDRAYTKVKEGRDYDPAQPPKTAREMWSRWWKYVVDHADAKPIDAETDPVTEGDWADINAHGHDS